MILVKIGSSALGIAWQKSVRPSAVDVELDRQRPGRNRGETRVAEALALDFPVDAVLVGALEHLPIGVAAHEANVWHGCETVEDLNGEWAADEIAATDDRVDALRVDLCKHGLERRQVPVDVGDGGDPHAPETTRVRGGEVPRRRRRAPGSPSTRNRPASA